MILKKALVLFVLLWCGPSALATGYDYETPTDDRWYYPHNFTPGTRPLGSVFSSVFEGVNDRRGFNIIAWDTATQIEPGLSEESYNIRTITVTLTNGAAWSNWPVDVTADEWYTMDINFDGEINADGLPRDHPDDTDGESDDLDPGRPIELTGAGFGPTHSYGSWQETSLFVGSDGNPCDPYPFVYQEETGNILHIEDNVKGHHNEEVEPPVYSFTPIPWAVGVPQDYTPGEQTEDFQVRFDVNLRLSEGKVRQYFQQQLAGGRCFVIISSMQEADHDIPVDAYNRFYLKEALTLPGNPFPDAESPRLHVVLSTMDGDYDGDNDIDLVDYTAFSDCLTGPAVAVTDPLCDVFDVESDNDVDLVDYASIFTGAR